LAPKKSKKLPSRQVTKMHETLSKKENISVEHYITLREDFTER
jgi:hypothetical protein